MDKKIWFKRKTYGYGWTPSSWEGWTVILVWIIVFLSVVSRIDTKDLVKSLIFIFAMTGLLIFICYKKGEKPRWQWGNDKKD